MAPRLAPDHVVSSFEAKSVIKQQVKKRKVQVNAEEQQDNGEDMVWDQHKKVLLKNKLKQYRTLAKEVASATTHVAPSAGRPQRGAPQAAEAEGPEHRDQASVPRALRAYRDAHTDHLEVRCGA